MWKILHLRVADLFQAAIFKFMTFFEALGWDEGILRVEDADDFAARLSCCTNILRKKLTYLESYTVKRYSSRVRVLVYGL